ncbi:MAG TPA: hypothetical protein VHU19_14560 [Pyrinomonadaceae bacterium]|jgi:hypothetical protein|nr:hypothetical protein [Pyrinomonadaceae bacterium]
MKNKGTRMHSRCAAAWLLLLAAAFALPSGAAAVEKLRPEEIVAKHLESVGPADARSSIHNRIVAGTIVATLHASSIAQYSGRAVIASEGGKSIFGMVFENSSYSQEKFGFDGEGVAVGYSSPGLRSNLGDFLLTHKDILKYGLVGGTLSSAWPLLNLSEKSAKLEYGGIKKIGGKTMHELKYMPRGGSDLQISLFFDTETFQHLRTEYTRFIPAGIGAGIDDSGSQRATRYKMVEEFSDFRKESGLTLPHNYKIVLELDTRAGTFVGDWQLTLTQFAFNQPIQSGSFNVNGNQ